VELTKQAFEQLIEQEFELTDLNSATVQIKLAQVESPDERIMSQAIELGVREPFSLLFKGPEEPFLEQHMYALYHNKLGRFELFLVPVGHVPGGYQYEAVFG